MKTKKLVFLAVLTGISMVMFVIEQLIPNPVPIPGVKLGLANIVTVYALYASSPKDAALVLSVRIVLTSLICGQFMSFLYSLSGGIFCIAGMTLFRKAMKDDSLVLCSIIGALLHNFGQISAAILLLRTFAVAVYFPVLIVSACVCGALTGITAQILTVRLKKIQKKY